MSDELQREFREAQAFFRLPGIELVEKDMFVVKAIAAIAAIDAAPFRLVFGGGTALVRAHKLGRRMSEDVDFKVVLPPGAPVSRGKLRQQLGALRDRVTAALQIAGFTFDATDKATVQSRNENGYTVYQLPYGTVRAREGLRATIQIELTYASLRLAPVMLPVSSFIVEAFGRAPEVPIIACVSITETAAEKLVSLTRRTAMELAGLSRDIDPALVRHIYDLHLMRDLVDHGTVATMAGAIAVADADEFRNQYPTYHADIAGETRKALEALRTSTIYRTRYTAFMAAMVYGERPGFDEALTTTLLLARSTWPG